jgi:hypothetical protein
MRIARRSLLVIVAAIIATAGLTLLWITLPPASALPASPPAPMPEPLAPTAEFSATLRLTPDRARVEVGQVLILTVELDVAEGCGYPIMELTVVEAGNNVPLFAHIEPSEDTIFPDVFPSVWSFRALRPGTATFSAETFGEGNCDGAWFWHYENAQTDEITVLDTIDRPYYTWIPTAYAPAGENRE